MFKKAKPFIIKTITPLHVGSGQDLGIVDMPIQRERHTSYPKIEASGLKGSIRENFRNNGKAKEDVDIIFGPEKSGDHAGALGFTDARILLFPVKSAKGVFAWVTSSKVLKRFNKEMEMVGHSYNFDITNLDKGSCLTSENSKLKIKNDAVVLEEYCFKTLGIIDSNLLGILTDFTKIDGLENQLLILSDDDFEDFVNLSTEVITRTKIDPKTGTVADGALFTEEYLPAESVLYSMAIASSIFSTKDKKEQFIGDRQDAEAVITYWEDNMPKYMQIGGNATIGKGIVEIVIFHKEDNNGNN